MTDLKVEEIRARLGDGRSVESQEADDIDYLLTKLDEAEKANKLAREVVVEAGESVTRARAEIAEASGVFDRLEAAEARERALIAGVREVDIALQRYAPNNAPGLQADLRAILYRLLPSAPTEEGKN